MIVVLIIAIVAASLFSFYLKKIEDAYWPTMSANARVLLRVAIIFGGAWILLASIPH